MWIYDVVWKLDWVYKVGTSWLLGLAHRMYEKKRKKKECMKEVLLVVTKTLIQKLLVAFHLLLIQYPDK